MSGSITVPSGIGTKIDLTQQFNNQFNTALAKSIADALANASHLNELAVTSVTGAGTAPPASSGLVNELYIAPSATNASITVPSGYQFVVDDSAGPDTIFGGPGLSIIGVTGNHTIVDPAVITLGDTSTASSSNITVTGAGDNVAVGNGSNTITGTGSGTMSGGTGINKFIESLGGSYFINSQGFDDTIQGADGGTTVNSSGPGASIVGGRGAVTASISGAGSQVVGGDGGLTVTVLANTVSGNNDTILGGGGAAHVTVASGASSVSVIEGAASLSVLDNGTADTIDAGSSPASITAPGGSFVRGGSGPLNFVGGTGPSTIVGATGSSTVFGGTGLTSVLGGASGVMTYVNTTAGGLFYEGGAGNETIDASLSKGSATIYGGNDPAGQNLLIGGPNADFINAGPGSDTMVGGGGANWFYLFKAAVGPAANEVISDFSAIDNVALVGYGPDAVVNAIAGATTTNGSTTITLSDNTKITFTGVTDPSALNGHIGSF